MPSKLSKIILIGTLLTVSLGMSIPVLAKDKAPSEKEAGVKVIEYKINISDLDDFRMTDKEKKKVIKRIADGFNAWNGLPGVCVKFKYTGLTTEARYKMGDKINVVTFSMDEDEFNKVKSRVKGADALAVTNKAGDEFDVIIYGEGFLGMDQNGLYLNFPGPLANDLQSAMVHEAGHALGLGHSKRENAAMYNRLPRTKRHKPVEEDDIKRARELYPCPKEPKTSYTPPPGWKPYGESVATPGGIPASAGSQEHERTTQEISDKYKWLQEQEDTAEEKHDIIYVIPGHPQEECGEEESGSSSGLCPCGSGKPYADCCGASAH